MAAGRVIDLRGNKLAKLTRLSPQAPPSWSLSELSGRLTEIAGQGAVAPLSAAVSLVHRAQLDGELVAWVALETSVFFPPDVCECGVDLESLVVVRASGCKLAARAADHMVRSGAFGLIVLDLGARAEIPIPMQGRLVGLAKRHDTAIVCLTEKQRGTPSLGSMVSLRVEALRVLGAVDIRVVKDKRRGPCWSHEEKLRGPAGMR